MGYDSRAVGHIDISPPLSAKEMRKQADIAFGKKQADDNGKAAYVEVHKITTETDDGAIVVLSGLRIVPAGEGESFKRYYLQDHIQEIVNCYPDRKYDGVIECTGEDAALWAFKVKGEKVVTLRAKITWIEED